MMSRTKLLELMNGPVQGFHYTEVVVDDDGNKITKMLFAPDSSPVVEVWEYVEYKRMGRSDKYNTCKRITEDLAFLFDFLLIVKLPIEKLNRNAFSDFIQYLTVLSPSPDATFRTVALNSTFPHYAPKTPYYAIERSMWQVVPICEPYKVKNRAQISPIGTGIGISPRSILRIAARTVNFLEWLKNFSSYRFRFEHMRIEQFYDTRLARERNTTSIRSARAFTSRSVRGFLSHHGLPLSNSLQSVDPRRIPDVSELSLVEKQISNPRDRLLYWLLKRKGFRISELLNVCISMPARTNGWRDSLEQISGDIFKDTTTGIWIICVRISKTGWRQVGIEPSDSVVFEALLDDYLKWRNLKLKKFGVTEHGYLLVGRTGQPSTYYAVRNQFRRLKQRAGLKHLVKFSIHSLRHFKVTEDRRAGLSFDLISVDTGHSPGTAERIYTHRTAAEVALHRDKVQQYLEEGPEQ